MQGAGLVLGERLGGVQVEGAGGRVGDEHLERRQLEAERLARSGAGGDDRRLLEGAHQGVALVQVERVDAGMLERVVDARVELVRDRDEERRL